VEVHRPQRLERGGVQIERLLERPQWLVDGARAEAGGRRYPRFRRRPIPAAPRAPLWRVSRAAKCRGPGATR
jgi:hypothetical protein